MIGSSSTVPAACRPLLNPSAAAKRKAISLESVSCTSPPSDRDLDLHQRAADRSATLGLLVQHIEHGGQVILRQRHRPGCTATIGVRLFSNGSSRSSTLANSVLPALLPLALTHHVGRVLDRFAIADARLVHAHVQVEIAQQPMLDDFQVQLAHAADQRLAGLFVFRGAEGRILPLHHLQHVGKLLALGRSLRLDGHRDDRLGELRSSPAGSDAAASHSVSPVTECRRPMMPTMSPAAALAPARGGRPGCAKAAARFPSCPCQGCRPGCWPSSAPE